MNVLLRSVIAIVIIVVLDGTWLTVMSGMYKDMVSRIQGKPLTLNMYGVVFTYVFMFLALIFIIFPSIDQDKTTNNAFLLSLKHAAIFGLVAHGIYGFTNLSAFSGYPWKVVIYDIMWGSVLYFLAIAAVLLIDPRKK